MTFVPKEFIRRNSCEMVHFSNLSKDAKRVHKWNDRFYYLERMSRLYKLYIQKINGFACSGVDK